MQAVPEQPTELRNCAEMPPAPPKPRTQRDVAEFLVDLQAAYVDCHGDLEGLNAWLDRYRAGLGGGDG